MSVLLVGLDNPQSSDPRHALFPHPRGCAGHRLWKMMMEVDKNFTRSHYERIPKTNLFPVGPCPREFRSSNLRDAGRLLLVQKRDSVDHVILLGNHVRDAVWRASSMNFNFDRPMTFIMILSADYAWVPHPSGRNHYYNDVRRRRRVARFLLSLL